MCSVRAQLNARLGEKEKLSVNDFVIKASQPCTGLGAPSGHERLTLRLAQASAWALKKVPEANSAWQDTFIRQCVARAVPYRACAAVSLIALRRFNNVDISVAVATDDGLITPVIRDAGSKGLTSISKEM
jgi:pyruvate dehydrogenase E2 component (dihydrolipoamide acetyltransferase)